MSDDMDLDNRDDAAERAAVNGGWPFDPIILARTPVEHYRGPAPPDYGPLVTYRRGQATPDDRAPDLATVKPHCLQGADVPERPWTVRDWIPRRAVTSIGGDGGTGKTLVAMQLLTSAATGKAWLRQPMTACRALGVFCEDDADELHRRQVAINEHYEIEFSDLENMIWAPRAGADAVLMHFDRGDVGTATDLYQQVRKRAQEFGAQLVVLDALHDVFAGNENARPQARQFINLLHSLAMEIDGAVVLTAHPSLTGMSTGSGLSGSTAWNNAVRSRLYLTRPEPDEDGTEIDVLERVLTRVKANYASTGDQLRLRWQGGVLVADEIETGVFAHIRRSKAETAFLEALDELGEQGRDVHNYPTSAHYAPKVMIDMDQCKGLKRHEIEKAMSRLFDKHEIRVETFGRPSAPSKRIARRTTPVTP